MDDAVDDDRKRVVDEMREGVVVDAEGCPLAIEGSSVKIVSPSTVYPSEAQPSRYSLYLSFSCALLDASGAIRYTHSAQSWKGAENSRLQPQASLYLHGPLSFSFTTAQSSAHSYCSSVYWRSERSIPFQRDLHPPQEPLRRTHY